MASPSLDQETPKTEELTPAAAGGFPKPTQAGTNEPSVDESAASTEAGLPTNAGRSDGQGRKRGPKPDHEGAERVAEIVARVAPDGDWRGKLDDVCEALDEAKIPFPRTWRRDKHCRGWADHPEKAMAIKAIEYRLGIAKQESNPTPETLS